MVSIGQRELALKHCLYRFLLKAFLRRFSNLLNPTGLTTFPIRASPDHCLRLDMDIGASAVFFALFALRLTLPSASFPTKSVGTQTTRGVYASLRQGERVPPRPDGVSGSAGFGLARCGEKEPAKGKTVAVPLTRSPARPCEPYIGACLRMALITHRGSLYRLATQRVL